MAKNLKHFSRTHILGENGYKSFALVLLPDTDGDSCVTMIRCKEDKVRKELNHWGYFNEIDFERVEELERGESIYLSERDFILRLS